MSESAASLSYHEPGIVTILMLASFLLLENVINYAFDRLLFCGLIGQIAVGIAWGTPGASIIPLNVQETVMQLGYIGLILLVFEGGLSTDLKTLKSNIFLSSLVALIGISAPIGLSFTLQGFVAITPVQAFAAGAALCSTSLGTTFTILSTSGLNQSRLGVVLSSAAMMDDIVGLVMSGIISSLGQSSEFSAITVIRPVFVSIAFAVVVPLLCLWLLRPLTRLGVKLAWKRRERRVFSVLTTEGAAVTLHTLVLIALVTGASYAGTSNLFAAYLAGAVISWGDGLFSEIWAMEASQPQPAQRNTKGKATALKTRPKVDSSKTSYQGVHGADAADELRPASGTDNRLIQSSSPASTSYKHLRATHIFDKFYSPALETILKPFFFASIGFSIPISQMFTGTVIWRSLVYTILMIVGKLLCGCCLIRFGSDSLPTKPLMRTLPTKLSSCLPWSIRSSGGKQDQHARTAEATKSNTNEPPAPQRSRESQQPRLSVPKPLSLYPAALLGSAMVARGEIGFLISSVAESNGIFSTTNNTGPSELFLVVTWAILLCTLFGPITVGILVKRVKRLQETERKQKTGKADPLGIWGITPNHSP